MTNKKHLQEIDALKGWAIFLVILGHAVIVYPINLHANAYCSALLSFICSFHIKLFFLVSGFCYSYRGGYKSYILKKIRRLLIPYYAFCIVEMIAKLVFSGHINRPRSLGAFVTRMLFYGGDYWFLWTLFVIFLFFPLLERLLKRGKAWEMICLFVLLGISLPDLKIELFGIGSVLWYLFWFTSGVVLRRRWKLDHLPGSKVYYAVAAILLAILQSVLVWNSSLFYYRILDWVCGAIGILLSFSLVRFSWFNNAFSPFGKYSLQLYLMNGLLLGISRIVICNILGVTIPAVIICFNMLVDFFLSYLLIKYVLAKIPFVRTLMGIV